MSLSARELLRQRTDLSRMIERSEAELDKLTEALDRSAARTGADDGPA